MTTPIIVRLITFINILVFFAWYFSLGNPTSFNWMVNHFLVSWNALSEGRFWVLITSVFSHSSLLHLFINMFVLRGFGTVLTRVLGTATFINFYLISGVMGSFMHALLSYLLLDSPELPALGASGAIAGIILFFTLLFPEEKLLLLGIFPIRARWAALVVIVVDIWGLIEQSQGGGLPIGHGAHLGGALMGIIWFVVMRNKIKREF